MKKEEYINRLKNALYITSTDCSTGIADRVGIGDSVSPEEMEEAIQEAVDRIMIVIEAEAERLSNHINDESAHVSPEDRINWDNKVSIGGVEGDELIFTK